MIEIREARKDDLRDIVTMLADDELGQQRESVAHPLSRAYIRAFDEIEADDRQMLMVAVLDGHVVGTLQISIIPGLARKGTTRGQLEAIRISRHHRGKGIGSELINWAVDECRRRQCGLVQLTSDKTRTEAHDFYSRMGFVATHEGFKLEL